MLHERVAELEKQLHARHEAEHHRLRSLSIGIRRELQGIIGIEDTIELLSGASITHHQRDILGMVSQKGIRILELVQEFCEQQPCSAQSVQEQEV